MLHVFDFDYGLVECRVKGDFVAPLTTTLQISNINQLTNLPMSKPLKTLASDVQAPKGPMEIKVPDIKDVTRDILDAWMRSLYDEYLMTDDALDLYYETIQYKGFNRSLVLKQLFVATGGDQVLAAQMVIAIALRGPRVGSKLKLRNGKSCVEMGIPSSGGKGSEKLTCNKIQAATADLAAFYLKKLNVPKRMAIDLPGWLQFPSAASIKMPDNFRENHRIFAERFSGLIGGEFNVQIYEQMALNSYLESSLKLF
jgi:hypothetical protein